MECWGPSRRARILARCEAVGAVLVLCLALSGGFVNFVACVALAAMIGSTAYRDAHTRVRADADGVEVRGRAGRRRVSWSEVTAIDPSERRGACARLTLRRGARIAIPRLVLDDVRPRRRFERVGCTRRDEMIERLEQLRQAAAHRSNA
jgi:hypothetical protein